MDELDHFGLLRHVVELEAYGCTAMPTAFRPVVVT